MKLTPPVRRKDTAKGHYYVDADGRRVPGVTTILGDALPKPALITWAANATADAAVNRWDELAGMPPAQRLKTLQGARYEESDKAKGRGTAVHRLAERLILGETVQAPEEIAGHVEAYARFLDEFAVKPVHVEFACVSYRHGYAGTADLIADLTFGGQTHRLLMDLKTARSGIYGETSLQLAAYRYADVMLTDDGEIPMPEVDGCAGIHVRADGYSLVPITAGLEEHRSFLYVQQVGVWAAVSRDLIGSPIEPPTTSRYRLTREPTP